MVDPDTTMEAVEAADRMTAAMTTLSTRVEGLSDYGKRSRHLIRLLWASVIFDLVLSIALGFIGITARTASERATAATAASKVTANNQHQTCLSGNEARALTVQLWDYVLASPLPRTDDAQKVADFRKFLDQTFAPRVC